MELEGLSKELKEWIKTFYELNEATGLLQVTWNFICSEFIKMFLKHCLKVSHSDKETEAEEIASVSNYKKKHWLIEPHHP